MHRKHETFLTWQHAIQQDGWKENKQAVRLTDFLSDIPASNLTCLQGSKLTFLPESKQAHMEAFMQSCWMTCNEAIQLTCGFACKQADNQPNIQACKHVNMIVFKDFFAATTRDERLGQLVPMG
ncbi:hypothetical protein [Crateriforma conspicua]|uniref:hypothetical protein n=1 Tax=Crateriforma conspicua TaxID=2527996 RepID=UPI0013FD040C|nr:hypothetical protein [Crateriforma conspicua]